MVTGDFYALGQKPDIKAGSHPTNLLDELVNYLIANTYTKLPYLKHRCVDPIAEIKAVLTADDIGQLSLVLGGEEGNPLALGELRQHLLLAASQNRVLLSDVVERFANVPWGWKPEWEIVLLVVRLFMAGEIKLMLEGSDLDPKSAVEPLTKSVRFKQISIIKRKKPPPDSLKRARDLHRELFSKLPREDEDGLVADFREHLAGWQSELKSYLHAASTKHFPGKEVIDSTQARINKQLAIRDTCEFIEALLADKDGWLDVADDIHDLLSFYKTQVNTWRRMLEALAAFADNREALQEDQAAANALSDLEAIRDNPKPYSQINRIDPLLSIVEAVNDRIAGREREKALLSIDQKLAEIEKALGQVQANDALRNKALYPLRQLKASVAALSSIPKIRYLAEQAGIHLDTAMDLIASAQKSTSGVVTETGGGNTTVISTGNAPPTVAAKPIKVIRATDCNLKTYLETESDVDAYLAKLRDELLATIREGKKARIQ